MKNLTVIMIVDNNEKTISSCLQSIRPYASQIIIGNLNSKDKTIEMCHGCEIIEISSNNPNDLLQYSKNDNVLLMQPWEFIASGADNLKDINVVHSSYIQILSGRTITKEVRIIKKNGSFNIRLQNFKKSVFLDIIAYSNNSNISNATFEDSTYYKAYSLIKEKKYDEFLKHADQYLFVNNSGVAATMLTYHTALVKVHHHNKSKEAIERIISCLSVNPLMAEFWCVLGDAFYLRKEYAKAISFYENAIILGSKRKKSDIWPVELDKYKDHPNKMIESSKVIIRDSKTYHRQ